MAPVLPDEISSEQEKRRDIFTKVSNAFVEKRTREKASRIYNYSEQMNKVALDSTCYPTTGGTVTVLRNMETYLQNEDLIAEECFATASGRYSEVTVAHKYGCTTCFAYVTADWSLNQCITCLQQFHRRPPEPKGGPISVEDTGSSSDEHENMTDTSSEDETRSVERKREREDGTDDSDELELKMIGTPSCIDQQIISTPETMTTEQ